RRGCGSLELGARLGVVIEHPVQIAETKSDLRTQNRIVPKRRKHSDGVVAWWRWRLPRNGPRSGRTNKGADRDRRIGDQPSSIHRHAEARCHRKRLVKLQQRIAGKPIERAIDETSHGRPWSSQWRRAGLNVKESEVPYALDHRDRGHVPRAFAVV